MLRGATGMSPPSIYHVIGGGKGVAGQGSRLKGFLSELLRQYDTIGAFAAQIL